MDNVFKTENVFKKDTLKSFAWGNLGDVKQGRGDLGEEMPIVVYRLMQYTLLDVLSSEFGLERANKFLLSAGYLAGKEFVKNILDLSLAFDNFISHLQETRREFKIGILRMEHFDQETGNMTLTIGEDLDCSGLPVTNENVCIYDEGFMSGIFESYTGKKYNVKEVDCWASGDRVCRFKGAPAA